MSSKQDELCFSVSAPGKIILHGEHSVVHGKNAVAASISHRTNVVWKVSHVCSEKLKLSLSAVNHEMEYSICDIYRRLFAGPPPVVKQSSLSDFSIETPELLDLPELLPLLNKFIPDASSLTRECKNSLLAFFTLLVGMLSSIDMEMKSCSVSVLSDLHIGAGLGSSASYSVALAAAILHFVRVSARQQHQSCQKMTREGFKAITLVGGPSADFSDDEKDLISRWAYQCERIMHGNPSGIDNLVCTHGSVIQFSKNAGGQGITWRKLPAVKEVNILLVNTKVSRNTSALVQKVAQKKAKFPSVIDAIFQVMDELALLAASVFEKMSSASGDNLELELNTLEELIDLNQGQLVSLGVSHPRLDRICETASRHGMHAKLTGAGGGGNAFVLVRSSASGIEQLRQELQADGYDCIETGIGREGVTLNSLLL